MTGLDVVAYVVTFLLLLCIGDEFLRLTVSPETIERWCDRIAR